MTSAAQRAFWQGMRDHDVSQTGDRTLLEVAGQICNVATRRNDHGIDDQVHD